MKKIFAVSFISVGYFLNAQSISNSPYATYGIGDVKYDNTIETASMGGISTAYISDFTSSFNFANPANNSNFELTSIKLEATNENNYFKTNYNNTKSTKHSTYLSNIALAFPLSQKVKMGLSYQPYSSKSYDIKNRTVLEDDSYYENRFKGSGTLNTAQVAVSYKIDQNFAVGLRANLYFGNLYDLNELVSYEKDGTPKAEYINGYETKNSIKNFNFTLGGSYQSLNTRTDKKLTIGATATFGNTSNMTTDYTNSTYIYADNLQTSKAPNSISVIEQKSTSSKNLLPLQASLGVGYGSENHWFVSGQLDYKKGEDISYFGKTFDFQDTYRISAGGWYLPNYNNFRNYFSRVVYRYGAFYERGNLKIDGNSINKFGISAGVLLPFKTSSITRMSGLELGVEVGKRGTLNNNLINQNFINLRVGFNFADRWFRKSLYN
ncbi:membrane protein [Chryseobacterium vrystaatense]|uniref:Long-chain fatty acid transport protein n=1 Tax=Chryseobacterium vrystaatense TaxID=307480 RepID=A0A1M5ITB1_9FLAO|nr:membrane protein [Chryseobacterium vrystaatense]KFF25542.1 membrane protein [Chryseobacterium vrystaatense]SHG31537.1 Long-chain fatty acid transport protein [Chryseobacterium vrystaatense]